MNTKPQALPYARGIGQLLSLRQAAILLGVSIHTARRLEAEGALGPTYKIGSSLRVTRAGVEGYQGQKGNAVNA